MTADGGCVYNTGDSPERTIQPAHRCGNYEPATQMLNTARLRRVLAVAGVLLVLVAVGATATWRFEDEKTELSNVVALRRMLKVDEAPKHEETKADGASHVASQHHKKDEAKGKSENKSKDKSAPVKDGTAQKKQNTKECHGENCTMKEDKHNMVLVSGAAVLLMFVICLLVRFCSPPDYDIYINNEMQKEPWPLKNADEPVRCSVMPLSP